MKQGAWITVGVLTLVCMAVVIVVSGVMGGCDHMLETTTAGEVPMKCHWTFVAAAYTGIIGLASAAISIGVKNTAARRTAAFITILTCVIVALYPTDLAIGLCANAEMHCHLTAYIVWITLAIAVILSIVQIVKANPADAEKPKMKL